MPRYLESFFLDQIMKSILYIVNLLSWCSYPSPPGGACEGPDGAGQGGGGSQATLADRYLHSQPCPCPPSHLFLPL